MEKEALLQQRPLLDHGVGPFVDHSPAFRDHEAASAAQDMPSHWRSRPWPSSRWHVYSWLAQLMLFTISISILFLAPASPLGISLFSAASSSPADSCTRKLSMPSPALAAVDDDDYQLVRFSGKVTSNPSQYKGPPTAERLAAWSNFTTWRHLKIDHDTLVQAGASEDSVKTVDGTGYVAGLEVYHHLHCLEVLWKSSWPEHYDEDADKPTSLYRRHVDHCADLLRQKLMCDADVGLVTLNWVERVSHPTPNFNILHKCRNWDAVDQWSKEHNIPLPTERPDDAVALQDFP